MTIAEIFSELSAHMIKGVMFHSQMADYYWFLGLDGYAKCHEKQYKCENKTWRKLSRYYIEHYNRLIEERNIDDPKAIPQGWWQYTRMNVDSNTRKKAVQTGLKAWHIWETETKALYEKAYRAFEDNDAIRDMMLAKELIKDVDDELIEIQSYMMDLSIVDYDSQTILDMQ